MKSNNLTVQIRLHDVDMTVVGDYYEGEKMVMYYSDMSGHPGTPPEFEINKVFIGDQNCSELFDMCNMLEEIEELCIIEIEI